MSPPRFELITFDVYTALADLEASLLVPLQQALGQTGGGGGSPIGDDEHAGARAGARSDQPRRTEAAELLRVWRSKQMEYALISNSMAGPRVPFRELTRAGLDYAATRAGTDLDAATREQLVEVWNELELWPEAREVVSAVKERGYPLAVLSNGDRAMLEALVDHTGLEFDHVFSAEDAGAYKPDPSVYALPLRELGLQACDVLHVAGSATDTMGAKGAGLACAWSNRHGDVIVDESLRPDVELADLNGLPQVV